MIGMLLIAVAVFFFMLLGYMLLMGPFMMVILIITILGFIGIIALTIFGALWEFWFPKPAKTLIANKRAPSWELKYDDVGFAELVPSHRYLPEGLIKYRFGWALLPRPVRKFFGEFQLKKKKGRKAKNPEDEAQRQKEYEARQKQEIKNEQRMQELAEEIALRKSILKGTGKPIWLQYEGLAANFNAQCLVPLEAKQDNPHLYFEQFKENIEAMDLKEADRKKILKKLEELKTHVKRIRVVINPRRFKEIHPKMFTQSQIDAHGRIHFELGRLSVLGMPMGKIVLILVICFAVVGALAALYFLFMKNPQPQPTQAIIHYLLR